MNAPATATPATTAAVTTARLTRLAELLAKAEKRGVPIPPTMHVHLPLGGVTFQATAHEYAAWCDLLENADLDTYIRDGIRWQTATATHEGLTVEWYSPTPISVPAQEHPLTWRCMHNECPACEASRRARAVR